MGSVFRDPPPSLGQPLWVALACPTSAQTLALAPGSVAGTHTVFDLGDVSNHNLGHRDLDHLASPDHGKLLLLLNAALQAPELLLFAPVIEGCDQDHTDDREEDGSPLDPACLRLPFIFCPGLGCCTSCREQKEAGGVGSGRQEGPHGPGFKSQLCQVKNADNQMIMIHLCSTSGCQVLCKMFYTHYLRAFTLPISQMWKSRLREDKRLA